MLTLVGNATAEVGVVDVRFEGSLLRLTLSDWREMALPTDKIDWLHWLATATPEQRANWSIEPGGFAIYWNDLDDGLEVCHVLNMQPLV